MKSEKIFQIFFFTFLNFYLATSQFQNLCRDARDQGLLFANDPSGCSRYLYCQFDGDQVIRVNQLLCIDPEFPIFFQDSCFPRSEKPCPGPDVLLCPIANLPIRVK
jgi:hypothetical protein